MESVVKKSLRKPIRTLTSCVTGAEDRRLCPKRRRRQSRGGGGRGGCNRLRKTCYSGQPKDPSSTRSYQADLDKERQVVEKSSRTQRLMRKVSHVIVLWWQKTTGGNDRPEECWESSHEVSLQEEISAARGLWITVSILIYLSEALQGIGDPSRFHPGFKNSG